MHKRSLVCNNPLISTAINDRLKKHFLFIALLKSVVESNTPAFLFQKIFYFNTVFFILFSIRRYTLTESVFNSPYSTTLRQQLPNISKMNLKVITRAGTLSRYDFSPAGPTSFSLPTSSTVFLNLIIPVL